MRTKVTLVLLLLNVALFAWIVHTRHRWQLEADSSDRDRHPLRELAVNLQAIEFSSPNITVRLERSSGKTWNYVQPNDWLANTTNVENLIRELQQLESRAQLDPALTQQTLADYDLEKPFYTLTLSPAPAGPKEPAPAPAIIRLSGVDKGGHVHLLAADGKRVHVIDGEWLTQFFPKLNGLREKRLFTIPVAEAHALRVQSLAASAVGQVVPVNVREEGGRWLLDSPIATRASKPKTAAALNGLAALRLFELLAKPAPPEVLRELRITVEGDKRSETLLLGQAIPNFKATEGLTLRYARLEGRETSFAIPFPNALFNLLADAQDTLRDPHVLAFDPAAVRTITLIAPSQPEPLVLQRLDPAGPPPNAAAGDWQIARPGGALPLPADRALVGNFLLRLSELRATRFASDSPSSGEVDKFGFSRPEREITLSLATGTGTAPAKLALEIGLDNNGAIYARAGSGSPPFIYALPTDALEALSVSPLTYRDRLVRTLPANARITSLSLTPLTGGTASYSLTFDEKETWEQALAAEKSSARREALQRLLVGVKDTPALLFQLRARSFVSSNYTNTVLVNGTLRPWAYRLTATYATPGAAAGAQATLTLDLADRAGSDQQAGSPADDKNVVFVLEPAFMDALDVLLTGERPPAPPPSAPAPALPGVVPPLLP